MLLVYVGQDNLWPCSSAVGAPAFALASAAVLLAQALNSGLGQCDPATFLLGAAPRSAYAGKVVWITGASQGLGEEIALHLATLGARLILSSRREETLTKVCEACAALVGPGTCSPPRHRLALPRF